MSTETTKAIHDAIQAHYKEQHGENAVLTDFFVAYAGMATHDEAEDGISYPGGYTTSNTSPYAVLGAAQLGLNDLINDLTPHEADDD